MTKVTQDDLLGLDAKLDRSGLVVHLARVERETTDQADEQVVKTAYWRYEVGADCLEFYNFIFAFLLSPVDVFGAFECGVCGSEHPGALFHTAVASFIPFLNVKRSATGGSPFFGATPTVAETVERTNEKREVAEKRTPLAQARIDIEVDGRAACSSFTDQAGDAVFSMERLREIPWERGAVQVRARETRWPLDAAVERALRSVRAEDLYARAALAEREERFDPALEAARAARVLGHAGAAELERRIVPAAALKAARRALEAGDLDEAGRQLAPHAGEPLTRDLAKKVLARLRRRSLLRARAHLAAGRPARALEFAAPLADSPEREEALALSLNARTAWARRLTADAATREPAEGLLLDGFALALARTREPRDAFALDLARGVAPETPTPARFEAALREAERFERSCAGSRDGASLRREARASLLALARAFADADDGEVPPRARALAAALETVSLTVEVEPVLAACRECRGSGIEARRTDVEPCRSCAGSGLSR